MQIVSELTPKEKQIIQLVSEGYTNKEIGKKLNKSTRTVETNLRIIYRLLGVKNRVRLVVEAHEKGII